MKSSSFSVIAIFTALILIGFVHLPLVNLKLLPDRTRAELHITYNIEDATPDLVDTELTTVLEGAFSRIKDVVKVKSTSRKNGGSISLEFAKDTDIDAVRFEVASVIRRIYPQLPKGVSYPAIKSKQTDKNTETILTYKINAPYKASEIVSCIEEKIKPELSLISDIHNIDITGGQTEQLTIKYRKDKLRQYGLQTADIRKAIRNAYASNNLGVYEDSRRNTKIPLIYANLPLDSIAWENITVPAENKLVALLELANVSLTKETPRKYGRINGLNAINLKIEASKSANFISLASSLKAKIKELSVNLPEGYSFVLQDDASVYLKKEIGKISYRMFLSLGVLLLFMIPVYRSIRYMAVVIVSLLANISIAFALYYYLKIEIQLFSMAGITVSLGIVIDNTIMMADHLRNKGNREAFLPILASTLTSVCSLLAIFFIAEQQKLKLLDFGLVIIVNLLVSLAIALWFVPALIEKIAKPEVRKKRNFGNRKKKYRLLKGYKRIILFLLRIRKTTIAVFILAFGIPVFLLPTDIDNKNRFSDIYNETLGSTFYLEEVKPWMNLFLGGTLRLFMENVKTGFADDSHSQTKLTIKGDMPEGSTLEQINRLMVKIEHFLAAYGEIDKFRTTVSNADKASIAITFTEEYENSDFPEQLKNELQEYAVSMTGIDWSIYGVGRGFNNSVNDDKRNSRVVLYGYNLEQLKAYAKDVKHWLEQHPRVDKVFLNGRTAYWEKMNYERNLAFDKNLLFQNNISERELMTELQKLSVKAENIIKLKSKNGEEIPVSLEAENNIPPDYWELKNTPLNTANEKTVKVKDYATFNRQAVKSNIQKVNMEYELVVEFDLIGSFHYKSYLLDNLQIEIGEKLPLGYRLDKQYMRDGRWSKDNKEISAVIIVLLIMTVIFFICSVLLESLHQPFAVILMIPFSFIGVFLTFYFFDIKFNQGGFAALLLLSGLTVNSALYIINDYNNNRKLKPVMYGIDAYIKAFGNKIIPIVLTILSTVLGLFPFLLGGKEDAFWFNLASGTMGGLIFSIIALLFILPLTLKGVKRSQ